MAIIKKLITTVLILLTFSNPVYARAGTDAERAACIFSFGIAKDQCQKGFNGYTLNEIIKLTAEESADTFVEGFTQLGKHENKSKIIDFVTTKVTPNEVWFDFNISGNGVSAVYETREKIEELKEHLLINPSDSYEVLNWVVPDKLRVSVGLNLAFILTVTAKTTITYTAQDDIKDMIDLLTGLQ